MDKKKFVIHPIKIHPFLVFLKLVVKSNIKLYFCGLKQLLSKDRFQITGEKKICITNFIDIFLEKL
jgi:hypothetical protein